MLKTLDENEIEVSSFLETVIDALRHTTGIGEIILTSPLYDGSVAGVMEEGENIMFYKKHDLIPNCGYLVVALLNAEIPPGFHVLDEVKK